MSTGIDVLVQVSRDAGLSCRGWKGIALDRSVRMLVLGGAADRDADAEAVGRALIAGLGAVAPGAVEEAPPCHGQSQDLHCRTEAQPEVRQVLVYVGDEHSHDSEREAFADAWVVAGGDAVAVVRDGVNPDSALPSRLQDLHVSFWESSIDEATLDVLAVAGVVEADQRMFISYSHTDGTELAHALFKAVTAARFDAFLDAASLVPGSGFAERIEHRLADAAFVVIVETPGSLGSPWVARELAFAGRVRAGIAAVGEEYAPELAGPTRARRIRLQPGELVGNGLTGPAAKRVVGELRRLHAATLVNRRELLERSLRCELRRQAVESGKVERGLGMLRVREGKDYRVALHPRPAGLREMHRADARCPPTASAIVLSPLPWGGEERHALQWLARGAGPPHADEARLARLVSDMKAGTV